MENKKYILRMKKTRSSYDIVRMMLIKMYRAYLLNTIDFMEYAKRTDESFTNGIVKTQVFIHVINLFDKRGFKLELV